MDKVLETLNFFPKQCEQAWNEAGKLELPLQENIRNICISSMGASSFGYYLVSSLYRHQLALPLLLNSDYQLPNFVTDQTLLITSSYSGSTEEVITNFKLGRERKAKTIGITQKESSLGHLLTDNGLPFYDIHPDYNPSGQPRMATGYTVIGLMRLLQKMGYLQIDENELIDSIAFIEKDGENIRSRAQDLAKKLESKSVFIVGAEHLSGNAHVLRNQFNETAKHFSNYFLLPELNHHLMEGLSFPKVLAKNSLFLLFSSDFYSDRIKIRLELTRDVIAKNGIETIDIEGKGKSRVEEAFYLMTYGGYLTYYLSKLNRVDPAQIPWVDYFKNKLAAHVKK